MATATWSLTRDTTWDNVLPSKRLRAICAGNDRIGVGAGSIVTLGLSFGTGNYPSDGYTVDMKSLGFCRNYAVPLATVVYATHATNAPYVALVSVVNEYTLKVRLYRLKSGDVILEELPNDSVSISAYSVSIPVLVDLASGG